MNSGEVWMKRALQLAKKGWGRTNPNPLVGAVIVKDGEMVAEGYHERLGCAHAEISAFRNARRPVAGGTLYVNLEPCSHYGRTPPCAKAIIEAGIKEVVLAMEDPNPKVSGRGIQMLREAGIAVRTGILEKEAKQLNEVFIHYITEKRPFVIMKTAMTLDGKIAAANGDSKWVTGENARRHVHQWRNRATAIMVGAETVIKDNPSLTTRLGKGQGRNPKRIVIDSRGRIPEDSLVFTQSAGAGTILAATEALDRDRERRLAERGIRVIKTPGVEGRVDLAVLMEELYKLEIDSILLEGGGTLNASAFAAGIVDKVMFFIAPKILGGKNGITPVEGEDPEAMSRAIPLRDLKISRFGPDILVEGYVSSGK